MIVDPAQDALLGGVVEDGVDVLALLVHDDELGVLLEVHVG